MTSLPLGLRFQCKGVAAELVKQLPNSRHIMVASRKNCERKNVDDFPRMSSYQIVN